MDGVLTREQIAGVLKGLIGRYRAQAAYLFGSYARGEATPESDIDVLVEGGPSFHPADIFAVAEELYRAFGKRVDVYEASEIDEGSALHGAIMRDRVLVA